MHAVRYSLVNTHAVDAFYNHSLYGLFMISVLYCTCTSIFILPSTGRIANGSGDNKLLKMSVITIQRHRKYFQYWFLTLIFFLKFE